MELDPNDRPSVSQLLSHQYFDSVFKYNFDNEFKEYCSSPKKNKTKVNLETEEKGYAKIYSKKNSPKFPDTNEAKLSIIGGYKKMPDKSRERLSFLPEIIKKNEKISKKKSIKYLEKYIEQKSDTRSFGNKNHYKSSKIKNNPSLLHDDLSDNMVSNSFNQLFNSRKHLKMSRHNMKLTPHHFLNVALIPSKYRLKRLDSSQNNK